MTNPATTILHAGRRQRGAVLIVTLLFLVVLTMLGVTAMTSTTMEERMAGNTRDASLALQAAEAALRDARRDISGIPLNGTGRKYPVKIFQFGDNGAAGTCSSLPDYVGLCLPQRLDYETLPGAILPLVDLSDATRMTAAPSLEFGQITGAAKLASTGGATFALVRQPRYLIEGFCLQQYGESMAIENNPTLCNFFRITARGYGRNPNTRVTLQEMFLAL
ncbi:MAG TPA: PilX N-terminal domain-containing pilus assembly protein [Thermoanaerobaculia bacterium]|nr:PilX N-terminal domain-containing pilus assembly protein [Burkholderiales bacterium]HYC61706.1 PilX N-terminal domain-containing pilus assembly protein [Thermoanaerobaculia bacterium]